MEVGFSDSETLFPVPKGTVFYLFPLYHYVLSGILLFFLSYDQILSCAFRRFLSLYFFNKLKVVFRLFFIRFRIFRIFRSAILIGIASMDEGRERRTTLSCVIVKFHNPNPVYPHKPAPKSFVFPSENAFMLYNDPMTGRDTGLINGMTRRSQASRGTGDDVFWHGRGN